MAEARLGSGQMFDAIAGGYDRLNRIMSLGLDGRWRRRLVGALPPLDAADTVLDLACGTGDVARAIEAAAPCRVVGVDPSVGMLAVGRDKVGDRVTLVEGDAQALDFADDHFAATTMAFGIRNVPDRDRALLEMARVTRSGGVVAILELGEPRSALGRLYVRRVVPRVGAWLASAPEYTYLARSIAAFPPAPAFLEQMRAAGLREVSVTPLTLGAVNLFLGRAP